MSIAGTNAITELWAKCKAYFQAKLVSGTNIKTINNESLLGSGNISVGGGGSGDYLPTTSPVIEEDPDNFNTANLYFKDSGGSIGLYDGEPDYSRDITIQNFQQPNAANPATVSIFAISNDFTGSSSIVLASDGTITVGGDTSFSDDADVAGTLTSNEISFSTTGVEGHFSNVTKSSRIAITSSNNLRVDSSSDSGSSWTTHGYAAQCTQASSASAYRAANQVLATPNGSAGLPSMRKLVAADMTGLGDTAKGAAQSAIDSATSNISTTSGTTKNLDSIVLAPGTWLVTYSVEFASNASGRRAMTLTTNNTSITSTPVYMVSGAPANGMATNLSRTQVIVNSGTSNITRYLNAYQNSGSALNCRSCIQAVRIA